MADGKVTLTPFISGRVALEFSARTVVMDRGRIVFDGESERLRKDPEFLASLIAAQ